MAYNPLTGKWEVEDDTLSTKVTGLMNQDNPLMQQAATAAKKFSSSRGLLNSSMAATAGVDSALKTVLPIASQESQQIHQKNLTAMDLGSRENIANMNVAAHDREKSTSAVVAVQNMYNDFVRTIMTSPDIPAATRDQYLTHGKAAMDSNMALIESLYSIDLTWATPSIPPTT